jgi:hypothetical protein
MLAAKIEKKKIERGQKGGSEGPRKKEKQPQSNDSLLENIMTF